MTKLSVIVPTFNRASFLAACTQSILEGFASDAVEVIVVDDGSTDETAQVARSLGPQVRYIYQVNAGPAAARNTGFAASVGEYIAFLDSDDRWIPAAARRLIEILDGHSELDLIFGDAAMGTTEIGFRSVLELCGGAAFVALPGNLIDAGVTKLDRGPFFRLLTRRNLVFLGSLILRRRLVEEVGGFETTLFGGEDWNFVMRLAVRYEFAYDTAGPVAFYIQHSGGISRDQDRMDREFAKALRHLAIQPDLVAEERTWVRDQLARQQFAYAYQAYDRGDLGAARERFGACLKTHPSLFNLGFWAAAHLPTGTLSIIRRWKRAVIG